MRNICSSTRLRWPKSSRRSTLDSSVVWNHSIQMRAKVSEHSPAHSHVRSSEKAFDRTIVDATKTRS
jgi:hypothetical protein